MQDSAPVDFPPGMLFDALNYEIDSRSALTPRTGFSLYSAAITPDSRPIRTIFHADFDGSSRILVATDLNVYEFVYSTDTWTNIYVIASGTKKMLFAMLNSAFAPVVVFGNGSIDLKQWNGTTVSNCDITNAPKGRPVAYKNYLAVFDIPNAPGKVQFTYNPGDPTTWVSGGVQKYIEMQGKVTSVYPFAGGLLVFTESRTSIFAGDPDSPEGVQHLSESTGCWHHETVADCGGFLTWLSRSGIEMWDGSGSFPLMHLGTPDTDNVSNIGTDIDRFAWDSTNSICGVYHPEHRAYYLSIQMRFSAGGSPVNRVYKFDFKNQAWFPWDLEITALEVVPSPITTTAGKQIILSGTATGDLRYSADNEFVDRYVDSSNDNTYTYNVRLGDFNMGLPNNEKQLHAIVLATNGIVKNIPLGARTLTVSIRGDFDRVKKTNTTVAVAASGFILDFSILGTGILADPYRFFEARQPTRLRTKHIGLVLSGSGTTNAVPINGIGIEWTGGVPRKTLIGG